MEPKPQKATIQDVARAAGVSIATVSRVINQAAPVAPQTVARVQAAIEVLNYQPQAAARTLAGRKTRTIGLLLPQIGTYFFFPMLLGVEGSALESGYNLLVHAAATPIKADPGRLSPVLGEHNTDGLIVFAHSLPDQSLRQLYELGLPLVLLHQSPPAGLLIPNITFENKNGARKLVEHLILAHGYRRIAFISGLETHEDSYWREMGYREALQAHQLVPDPALRLQGSFNPEVTRQAVARLLAEGTPVDAIFAADDVSASGALMALREAGLRIPEDVAVVGFDDTLLAAHLTPPLTTVHAPIEQAGREAVTQLLRRIRGEDAQPLTLLPTEVVIRNSCGCGSLA